MVLNKFEKTVLVVVKLLVAGFFLGSMVPIFMTGMQSLNGG